jgi:beta-phosphoglucomutase-like phosphatase (HAD superfamily)
LSLEVTGLASLFGGNVFSADQVARGKPAPDLYMFAARTFRVSPENCIVVEDSALGVRAARAAGMSVIGFTGGVHAGKAAAEPLAAAGACPVISSMAELPAAVAQLMPYMERGR